MRELVLGDRVHIPDSYSGVNGGVDGTVIDIDHNGNFSVRRDDDEDGSGIEYINSRGKWQKSWMLFMTDYTEGHITLLETPIYSGTTPSLPETPMMGLSPEEIDQDAYRAFMRDLQ